MAEPTTTKLEDTAATPMQKYRTFGSNADTLEKIQEDFRRAVIELESRCKLMIDELKRVTG
jgi:hypothetical protein